MLRLVLSRLICLAMKFPRRNYKLQKGQTQIALRTIFILADEHFWHIAHKLHFLVSDSGAERQAKIIWMERAEVNLAEIAQNHAQITKNTHLSVSVLAR